MLKRFVVLAIVSMYAMTMAACSQTQLKEAPKESKQSKTLVLIGFGPRDIKAGTVFNKQPNGDSAIWSDTKDATPTTVLVLSGIVLDSAPQKEGTVVTAFVPKKLYEKAGEYPLYLWDKKTNEKSNELKFVVKP